MDARSFIFDFIVNRLEFNTEEYKYNDIIIAVKFRDVTLELQSSKNQSSGFKEGRSYEFVATNEDLAKTVESPIEIQLTKLEKKIGAVIINWDQGLIQALGKESFSGHSQFEESDILNDDIKIGNISVAINLHCKCKEDIFKNYGTLVDGSGKLNISNEMDDILDPTDVLFVIGDSAENNRNVLNQCTESECPAKLDVSRYQIVRGKLLKDAEILNPCGNLACCELTNVQSDYDHTMKDTCEEKQDCSISVWSGSPGTSCSMPKRLSSGDFTTLLSGNKEVQNRFQPKCSENINLTSKFGLPKNHLTSTVDDMPCNNKCTVASILKQWNTNYGIKKNYSKTSICITENKCICTCKEEKICPHCRINKVVNKLLQDIKFNKCNAFTTTNSNDTDKTISHDEQCYNVLKEYGSEESISAEVIPYLSKTLQALKAKYKFNNDDGHKKEQKLQSKNKKRFKISNINKINGNGSISFEQNLKNFERTIECCPKENLRTQEMSFKCNQRPYIKKLKYRSRRNTKYPGVIFGHKTCKGYGSGVPKNMGWLWNKNKFILRKGWKPGAIGKPIKDIMRYFLSDFPADTLLVSNFPKQDKHIAEHANSETATQQPTLKVIKRNGEYLITMRPLKHIKDIQYCYNPYLNVKPIQFRIIKSPMLIHKRDIKNDLKKCGYNKCTCHLPLPLCFCRSFLEKERLGDEVKKICENKEIPNIKDTLVFSDTTDSESELDIEFTPPVGLFKPHLIKQNDIACKETQYNINDFITEQISAKLNGIGGNNLEALGMEGTGKGVGGAGGKGPGGVGGKGPGGVGGKGPGGVGGKGPGGVGASGKSGFGGLGAGGKGAGGLGAGGKGGIGGLGAGGRGGNIVGGKGGSAGGKGATAGGKGANAGGKAGSAGKKGSGAGKGGKGGGKNKNVKGGDGAGAGAGSPKSAYQYRKEKLNELMSVAPPILCMVDRRGATGRNQVC